VPKGESANYLELVKALQDATKQGSTGFKSILPKVFPGLCKFSDLPPTVIPLLIAVMKLPDKKDESIRKLQRIAFYLLQVSFSPGSAGTPQPYAVQSGNVAQRDLPPMALASGSWADAKTQDTTLARQRLALRLLAAMARAATDASASGGNYAVNELSAVVESILKGPMSAQPVAKRKSGLFSVVSRDSKSTKDGSHHSANPDAMRATLPAIRVGLVPHPSSMMDVLYAGYDGLTSPDPLVVRHALALVAAHALQDPVDAASRTSKILMATLNANAQGGLLFTASVPSGKSPKKNLKAPQSTMALEDPYARIYLSRLCSAVVHSDHFSVVANRTQAAPYWLALVLLATRDPVDLVVMESTRQLAGMPPQRIACLSGSFPSANPLQDSLARPGVSLKAGLASAESCSPFSPTAAAFSRAARKTEAQAAEAGAVKIRAWMMILKETQRSTLPPDLMPPSKPAGASAPPPQVERADKPSETLIACVTSRLRSALKSRSAPLICTAARTAAALCEARALAVETYGTQAQGGAVVIRAMELLQKDLVAVAEAQGSPQQCSAALVALLWMQLDSQASLLTPLVMYQLISSGASARPWPSALVARVLDCLMARLIASHSLAPLLLKSSVAVAAAAPSHVNSDQLTLLWSAALQCGPAGRVAAVHAAFELLDSPPPPICTQPPVSGPHEQHVAAAARRESAAWSHLNRISVWWLGANANMAAGEIVWSPHRQPMPDVSLSEPSLEVLAKAGERSLLLTGVISQLQRGLMVGSWEVRVAAAQAIGKVAIRSPEPYRLQCYSILKAVVANSIHEDDPLGLTSTTKPILRILDACYSSACVLETCIARWGDSPASWPQQHIDSLCARHQELLTDISSKVCYVPLSSFLPLGPASLPLVRHMLTRRQGEQAQSELDAFIPSTAPSAASGIEGSGLEELLDDAGDTTPVPGSVSATDNESELFQREDSIPVASDEDSPRSPSALDGSLGDHLVPQKMEAVGAAGGPQRAIVIQSYNPCGDLEDELEVEEDEELSVIEEAQPGWCRVRTLDGETGVVPESHLQIMAAELPEAGDHASMMPSLSAGLSTTATPLVKEPSIGTTLSCKQSLELGVDDEEGEVAALAIGGGAAVLAARSVRESDLSSFEFDSPSSKAAMLKQADVEQSEAEAPESDFSQGLFGSGTDLAALSHGSFSSPISKKASSAWDGGSVIAEPCLEVGAAVAVDTRSAGLGESGDLSFSVALDSGDAQLAGPVVPSGFGGDQPDSALSGASEASNAHPPSAVTASENVLPSSIASSPISSQPADPFFSELEAPPPNHSAESFPLGIGPADPFEAPADHFKPISSAEPSSSADFFAAPGGGFGDAQDPFQGNAFEAPTPESPPPPAAVSSVEQPTAAGTSEWANFGGSPDPKGLASAEGEFVDFGTMAAAPASQQPPGAAESFAPSTAAVLSCAEELSGEPSPFGDDPWVNIPTGGDAWVNVPTGGASSSVAEAPHPNGKQSGCTATVRYAFDAQEAGEISVSQDDIVKVVEGGLGAPPQSGWTKVETSSGGTGVVPTDYLRFSTTGGSAGSGSAARVASFPCPATVQYDFMGEAEGELTVTVGQGLVVLSELDGWFEVRRQADGAAGLVPASFLQVAR